MLKPIPTSLWLSACVGSRTCPMLIKENDVLVFTGWGYSQQNECWDFLPSLKGHGVVSGLCINAKKKLALRESSLTLGSLVMRGVLLGWRVQGKCAVILEDFGSSSGKVGSSVSPRWHPWASVTKGRAHYSVLYQSAMFKDVHFTWRILEKKKRKRWVFLVKC